MLCSIAVILITALILKSNIMHYAAKSNVINVLKVTFSHLSDGYSLCQFYFISILLIIYTEILMQAENKSMILNEISLLLRNVEGQFKLTLKMSILGFQQIFAFTLPKSLKVIVFFSSNLTLLKFSLELENKQKLTFFAQRNRVFINQCKQVQWESYFPKLPIQTHNLQVYAYRQPCSQR